MSDRNKRSAFSRARVTRCRHLRRARELAAAIGAPRSHLPSELRLDVIECELSGHSTQAMALVRLLLFHLGPEDQVVLALLLVEGLLPDENVATRLKMSREDYWTRRDAMFAELRRLAEAVNSRELREAVVAFERGVLSAGGSGPEAAASTVEQIERVRRTLEEGGDTGCPRSR